MAFPTGLPTFTLTGRLWNLETGFHPTGTVTVAASSPIQRTAGGDLLVDATRTVSIQPDGTISIVLPVTNSAAWTPTFHYTVSYDLDDLEGPASLDFQVDASLANTTVDLINLVEVVSPDALTTYMPRTGGTFSGPVTFGASVTFSQPITTSNAIQAARLGAGVTPTLPLDIGLSTNTFSPAARFAYSGPAGNSVPLVILQGVEDIGNALGVQVSGDTQTRLAIRNDGRLGFGPGGSSGRDVFVRRTATGTLIIEGSTPGAGGTLQTATVRLGDGTADAIWTNPGSNTALLTGNLQATGTAHTITGPTTQAGSLIETGGTQIDKLGVGKAAPTIITLDVASAISNSNILAVNYTGATGNIVPMVQIGGVETTGNAIGIQIAGDTQTRLAIRNDGRLGFGPGGSVTRDTFLERTGVAALTVTGSLNATGGLSVNGTPVTPATFVRKAVDTTLTSTTTVVFDELVAATIANATYEVDVWAIYDTDATAGLKLGWTAAASSTIDWSVQSDGATTTPPLTLASNPAITGFGVGTKRVFRIKGMHVCGASAGTLRFRWAQNTSQALNSTMYIGSWLKLTRLV